MTHLTTDERLALIESAGAPNHPHLATCVRCRAEVEEGRIALGEVRLSEVPEPSPLFWDPLSARVSERVAAGPETRRRPVAAWRVLVPTAVGVIAVVLAVWIDRGGHRTPAAPAPVPGVASAETAVVTAGDDESWSMLGQLAGEMDVDTLSDTLGTSEASGAERAVYQLNAEERADLAGLLQAQPGQGPAAQ